MSLYAHGDFGYLQQVEAFYLSLSQIGVMMGARDAAVVGRWRDDGVPVEVVCRGIRQAFDAFDDDPPRSIYACRRHVEREVEAFVRSRAGTHASPTESAEQRKLPGRDLPDPMKPRASAAKDEAVEDSSRMPQVWVSSMDRLVELGQGANPTQRDHYRWAYRQMKALERDVLEDASSTVHSTVSLAIGEIEATMYQRAFTTLPEQTRVDADKAMPRRIVEAMRMMSREARETQERAWRRRWLEEHGLRPFFLP